MIGRGMIREGVTQTAGALANTALSHITGVDVPALMSQAVPALAGTMLATGGATSSAAWTLGAGAVLLVGAGGAGYAIGQLNQAQDDIDDQRERQIVLREMWEEENGPLEEHIAAAGQQFIEDLEAADDEYSGLEITDEPDEDEAGGPDVDETGEPENIIGGSGKSGTGDSSSSDPTGGDPSGGGGGGDPHPFDGDDEPASKPLEKRKPDDHSLPKWFALSFLDWLKNLLEGYKMLVMASYFAGVLVKKFIFSPNRKKDDRLVA